MTNLVIDIGNTFSKLAIFNNRDIKSVVQVDDFSPAYLSKFLEENKINNSIISSVKAGLVGFEEVLAAKTNYVRFGSASSSKIKNHYKTPQTLGLDRYAAIIGVSFLYPNQNCLVIDAGTCITYDFVDAERNYSGGSISPGLRMRFKAMNSFTGRLPLVEPEADWAMAYGNDTNSSLLSGVQNGIIYEMLGFINSYHLSWPDLKVVLCGGDINFFDTELKNSIFAHALKTEPDLVLTGLNEVIYYNND